MTLELRPGSGSLYVNSTPPEAEVGIDGRRVGTTPYIERNVASGPHTVRVTKPDHLPWEESVVVAFNEQTTVPVTLEPCGYLTVEVTPSDARVSVDGREASRVGLSRFPLSVGEHRVSVTKADHDSLSRTVTIRQGETATVRERLPSLFGAVRVTSTPSGANVSSEPPGIAGTTPLTAQRLLPGTYSVRLTMTDRVPHEGTVRIIREQTATVDATLPFTPAALARQALARQAQERERARQAELRRIEMERLAEQARRAQMKAGFRWTSFAVSALAAGIAYKFDTDAKEAADDRDAAYERYQQAIWTHDAAQYRAEFDEATSRFDSAAKKRTIFYGVAGAGFSVGIVLWVF